MTDDDTVFRTHRPGDIGYIVHRHGVLYAAQCGWGLPFEGWVARIMASFAASYDPARERCWIAEDPQGSFRGCVLLCRDEGEGARIRVLLVEPEARGRGLGRRLSRMCVDFARECGYAKVTLTTQSNLAPARHMYEDMGFRCLRTGKAEHFEAGGDSQEETWELEL
ncbi:MarR family transcriptional regulator [Cordyceps fumosorosea ARSEF 2679]|uniref:MarR family transcriptional regulator n=1 Tax=Cordyceps fumosorosea (strain ARSEF 2679) TaxID=1081104 RepID=A0A162MBL2_CORFA|nr:MarR family transcriptional regulator [Cordyceps fumosorosea ARSEF 2679]OAA53860.1 MarR family transcriptional regulator [Cordyceps fumosorosea ARSEF 2679]